MERKAIIVRMPQELCSAIDKLVKKENTDRNKFIVKTLVDKVNEEKKHE